MAPRLVPPQKLRKHAALPGAKPAPLPMPGRTPADPAGVATQTLRKGSRSTTLVRPPIRGLPRDGWLGWPLPDTSMSSIPPIGEGTIVNNRYEIRKKLGSGGMGEVYLAFDRIVQQPVALKVVREDAKMPGDEEAMRQSRFGPVGRPPQRLRCTTSRPRVRPHHRDGVHPRRDAARAHFARAARRRLQARRVSQNRQRDLGRLGGHSSRRLGARTSSRAT